MQGRIVRRKIENTQNAGRLDFPARITGDVGHALAIGVGAGHHPGNSANRAGVFKAQEAGGNRQILVALAPRDQLFFHRSIVDGHGEMGRGQMHFEQTPRCALVELGCQLTNLLDRVLHKLFKKNVHGALRVGMTGIWVRLCR